MEENNISSKQNITGSSVPICKDGKYTSELPEGATIKALIAVNGEAVMGTVKNVNGKAVASLRLENGKM